MQFTFVGSGDAFGSGGRFNTCFHVATEHTRFLIDCGASSLIAMKRLGIDRAAIDLVLLTHFHADHFGGLPFFLLDAQLVAKRTRPLTIAGPPGLRAWCERIFAATFPGERTLPSGSISASSKSVRATGSASSRSPRFMFATMIAPGPALPFASAPTAAPSATLATRSGPRP